MKEIHNKAYKHLKFLIGKDDNQNVLHFPSLDTLPYDRISQTRK